MPSPTPTPAPTLPREVAGFRLRRELGRGGMGIVYEAEEISSGRRLALKVLLADLAVSTEAYERFQREARLAAAISHAQCVFVYGAHQVEGAPAIAMEIVDGETIEQKIARGEPIPIETAVRWTIDLIDGLEAAHRAGILHRDVKPSNCFVTTDGRVKVGDFGLSRSFEQEAQLTRTGQFLGSPLYASPEQVRGRALDERSDMYSCGATLYAILTGRAPYSGSNVGEVLARILSEPPDPMRVARPAIPAALERVVLRAMERDPEKRWRDLAAFREALAPFASSAETVAPRWRRFVAYLLDTAVLMVLSSPILLALSTVNFRIRLGGEETVAADSLTSELLVQALSFLYFLVGEGRFGTTVGKWLLGLRVLSTTSREPSWKGAALRGMVFQGPTFLARILVSFIGDVRVMGILAGVVPLLLLCALFITARRANGWRGLHDLWSGTAVHRVPLPFGSTRSLAAPPEVRSVASTDLPDRIGDYAIEGILGRTRRGELVAARDCTLDRAVWISTSDPPGKLADEERRSLSRPGRLRWLGTLQMPRGIADVFESPGGTSLLEFATREPRIEWWRAQKLLIALVRELQASGPGRHGYAVEQVWIDRNWNVRVLDEPLGKPPFGELAALDLVRECARVLFRGDSRVEAALPPDLPMHAESTLRRLLGHEQPFASLAEAGTALERLEYGPAQLTRRSRAGQLTVNALLPLGLTLSLIATMIYVAPMMRHLFAAASHMQKLEADDKARAEKSIEGILTDEERNAHEILLLGALEGEGESFLSQGLEAEEQARLAEIRARHPQRNSEVVGEAKRLLAASASPDGDDPRLDPFANPWLTGGHLARFMAGTWLFFALILSVALRGGLTLSIFGIRVRDRRGNRASRWLCGLRSLLPGGLVFGASWVVVLLLKSGHQTVALLLAGVVLALLLLFVVRAMLRPQGSVVDRLLGTRLVPN